MSNRIRSEIVPSSLPAGSAGGTRTQPGCEVERAAPRNQPVADVPVASRTAPSPSPRPSAARRNEGTDTIRAEIHDKERSRPPSATCRRPSSATLQFVVRLHGIAHSRLPSSACSAWVVVSKCSRTRAPLGPCRFFMTSAVNSYGPIAGSSSAPGADAGRNSPTTISLSCSSDPDFRRSGQPRPLVSSTLDLSIQLTEHQHCHTMNGRKALDVPADGRDLLHARAVAHRLGAGRARRGPAPWAAGRPGPPGHPGSRSARLSAYPRSPDRLGRRQRPRSDGRRVPAGRLCGCRAPPRSRVAHSPRRAATTAGGVRCRSPYLIRGAGPGRSAPGAAVGPAGGRALFQEGEVEYGVQFS